MVIHENDPACFQTLIQILGSRGVVILKSDTLYGLTGIAPDTGHRINRIKQRDPGKPLLQLIPDPDWVTRYADALIPPELSHFWPGPLTIIFPVKGEGSTGLRVPEDLFLQNLLYRLNKPLFSTSVNKQGKEPLGKILDIIQEFENEVDLIVDSGNVTGNVPSTILDITSTPYKIIRQGRVIIPPGLLT
jgi:L-threonylcarbamoyladenylate synthase